MVSPRPFYPLQQPSTARSGLPVRSTPVRFQPLARTASVSAATLLFRGSVLTSPFPVKLPGLPQSLRTTSLPGRAESASSGTALEPSSTLLPRAFALHAVRRCQTEIPHDP